MKVSRIGLVAVCCVIAGTASMTLYGASDDQVGAAAERELAAVRHATAKYTDVNQAIADGYVNLGYRSGEGYEFVNISRIDCTFDAEHPEALHYVLSGNRLRLVGVEYAVPIVCTPTAPPEGFTGDADEWEDASAREGVPFWVLNAWIWFGNPNGVFAEAPHPRIP
jgi:hypothetical protein